MLVDSGMLARLMADVLNLRPVDPPDDDSSQTPLNQSILEILNGYQAKKETFDSALMSEYVYDQLVSKFIDVGEGEDNFNTDLVESWGKLFELDMEEIAFEFALFAQILLNLSYISLINKQKLGRIPSLKCFLWRILDQHRSLFKSSIALVSELYVQILATDCHPLDLIGLYTSAKEKSVSALEILNLLANSLSDPYSQSFLYFENVYKSFKLNSVNFKIAVQLWTIFNNVTSNRILSLNNNLFIEIRQSTLCVSDDEFILAIFENFEFSTDILYNITLNVEDTTISLYVDGNLVESLSLPQKPLTRINVLELGSMICSFKVLKFWVWSEPLYEASVKLTNRLPLQHIDISDDVNLHRNLINLPDPSLLREILKSTETPGMTLGICMHHVTQLNTKNLLASLIPQEMIDNVRDTRDDTFAVDLNRESQGHAGKMLFYRNSHLLSCFEAVNYADIIINLLQGSSDLSKLYDYMVHFVTLLSCPELRIYFEDNIGYKFLGLFLSTKLLPQLGTNLSLPFMNLFLEYCGWSSASPTESIVRNVTAYGCLVANFDLWVPNKLSTSFEPAVEITRFLFYQLQELLQTSSYRDFNFQQLSKLKVVEKLTMQLHLAYSKKLPENYVERVRNEFIEVLTILIKLISKEELSALFTFAYNEVKKGLERSAAVVLFSLNSAFVELLKAEDDDNLRCYVERVPVKILLMILDAGHSIDVMAPTISILVKFLSCSPPSRSRFIKNNGFRILFNTIKESGIEIYEELIFVILAPKLVDIHARDAAGLSYSPEDGIMSMESIEIPEYHNLVIDLLEWAVLHDVNGSLRSKTGELLYQYLSEMTKLQENSPASILFDTEQCSFLEKAMKLLMTLHKYQDSEAYVIASQQLTAIISNTLLHSLTFSSTKDFARCLHLLTRGKGNKVNKHYLEKYFWLFPFMDVLSRLESFIPSYEVLLKYGDYIFTNFIHLLETFSSNSDFYELSAEHYLKTHKIATSCAECLESISLGDQNSVNSRSSLARVESKTILGFFKVFKTDGFYASSADLQKFVDVTLMQQSVLFGPNSDHRILELESVSFLIAALSCTLDIHQSSQSQSAILNCLRIIVLHHEDQLVYLACLIDRGSKSDMFDTLTFALSASDEDLLKHFTLDKAKSNFHDYIAKQFKSQCGKDSTRVAHTHQITISERCSWLLEQRKSALDGRYLEVNDIHKTFLRDGMKMSERIAGTEDRKLVYHLNDKEDELIIFNQRYFELNVRTQNHLRVQGLEKIVVEWTLDPMEDANRMRKRLIPDYNSNKLLNASIVETTERSNVLITDHIDSHNPDRRASSTMSFEFVNELDSLSIEPSEALDRNRKVIKLLDPGDSIRRVWNCSNVIGLNINEGVLILGTRFVYFMTGFFFSSRDSKVVELWDAPSMDRDPAIRLISGSEYKRRDMDLKHNVQKWEITQICFVIKRPFLLRDSAIEISFDSGKSCFYTFHNKNLRDDAYRQLDRSEKSQQINTLLLDALGEAASKSEKINMKNGLSEYKLSDKVANVFSYNNDSALSFKALKLWQSGQLSNFYYLIVVNTLAGRTFNDITQYPVFPWVIADYHSTELDLNNPKTFRDLSKPMGAQTEHRKKHFIERFDALKELDEGEPPFHYGTHYSSAMIVSSYMMRLAPFVDSYLLLQDGKFGHADRLFNSVERTWDSAARENTTDVRELIPEFYYLPEFLMNTNCYDFGTLQNGKRVDNVNLPPWAQNDPKIFVEKNREALECPFVSERLHEWIDLIFGCKQTGDAAIEAVNVFNRLSYPGAVNLDKIGDVNERMAVTGIIHNFGQTPLRIFDQPHPRRSHLPYGSSRSEILLKLSSAPFFSNAEEQADFSLCLSRQLAGADSILYRGSSFWRKTLKRSASGATDVNVRRRTSIYIGEVSFSHAHHCKITSIEGFKSNQFFTADECGLVKLWNYRGADNVRPLVEATQLKGHVYSVQEMNASCEYNLLLTLDSSGQLFSWDILSSQVLQSFSTSATHSALSKSTAAVAFVDTENEVSVCNLNGSVYVKQKFDRTISCLSFVNFEEGSISAHSYWTDKELLAIGLENGDIKILSLVQSTTTSPLKMLEIKTLVSRSTSPIKSIQIIFECRADEPTNIYCEVVARNDECTLFVWN
ncbi:LANO_0G03510g1_1 [Lachancea nothofagi CBS 11611]|uniref:Beige protein homolog 1 n=1 Tax=Lachancea nothofagi CBS 11611 TaxID=1266666 RepID=A0A1G4KFR7_9SACH|nr:LANO_0G03510g1_1 [Lachancea nothofagi CBS 11611]